MKHLATAACALLLMGTGWPLTPKARAAVAPFLTFSTPGASIGQQVQAVGTGLPASTPVRLIWFQGAPRWQVKDGLFNGVKVGEKPVQIAIGTTDAQGKQKTNSANVSYFQIPMLNAIDHPGEHLPAFHLSFQVQG